MKTFLLTLFILSYRVLAFAQDGNKGAITSGKITYEEIVKLQIKLEGDAAQFAGNLPKERKAEKILSFTKEATLFEDGKSDNEEAMEPQEEGQNQVKFRVAVSGNNKIYTDLKNNTIADQRDFMNRLFIVEKEIPASDWKITGNQKEILGYKCFEAVRKDTAGIETTAWFTPDIKISSGPAGLGNLPGIILEADINKGSRMYIAKAVEPADKERLTLQKPKEGKKVSDTEFKKIVAEKMKEMGINQGSGDGGAQVHIIIRNQ